ncbi:hypothetical protein [Bacillus pseudomycoides]|uniref:hypothetical protein n=1 Tax=Bacillus pseudomycoides TaxID=64104 RepID=UPI000BF58026|nr:hypothetical protein [Bacillus pseudomycoides]
MKLYEYNLKDRHKTQSLGGSEQLAIHRSGQNLFLPRATLKQREKTSSDHFFLYITGDFMLKNQNGFIYL